MARVKVSFRVKVKLGLGLSSCSWLSAQYMWSNALHVWTNVQLDQMPLH